jgi:polysaccharide deacetylase family protein (PEP-CTERM system associated)
MINALTVDVEDWYHLCGLKPDIPSSEWDEYESRVIQNTRKILKIFSEGNVKATFFVLGYIAQRYPELVREIDANGHEIATHGFWHHLVYQQDRETFRKDLKDSINLLQDLTGKRILGHRAASFSITRDSLWALEILSQEGLRYDCSIFPIIHPRYGIVNAPRFPYEIKPGLIEFPPSTIRILGRNLPIAGGAYFRALPYLLIKNAIKKINRAGKPVQIYIHPWEIDPAQPRLNLPLDRRIPHYINIRHSTGKLQRLLSDFAFGPMRRVLGIG